MKTRAYEVKSADDSAVRALAQKVGVGLSTAKLLYHRQIPSSDLPSWLEPKLQTLTPPAAMMGRQRAAERLAEACTRGERVAIFGDYDVDGTTSAAILADVLEALGAKVFPFVANRFQGGYGFSDPALDRVLTSEPDLLVTCDCGSADHPRIRRAHAAGVPTIVVDHHLVPDEPLPALAFLNPHHPDCAFPFKEMCSAGLAFSLAAAVRAELGAKLDLRRWLDLVALGTVADVVPLIGDNRTLVRAGLTLLSSPRSRPGITALKQVSRIRSGEPLGAKDIAFRLAPRLNAAGRLGDPTVTLNLLRAKSMEEAMPLASTIDDINSERKDITRISTEEAVQQVRDVYGEQPAHGIVVASERWHRGVVGITAARLVEEFDVPAVVIALDRLGHGSARTPDAINIHAALCKCADHLNRFGGHEAAAGLTLEPEKLPAFRESFAAHTPRPDAGEGAIVVDVEVAGDYDLPTVSELRRLEPLGEENPEPIFALPDVKVLDAQTLSEGLHLKMRLQVGDTQVSAFWGGMAHRLSDIGDRVTVVGRLSPDSWRGGEALEISPIEVLTQ